MIKIKTKKEIDKEFDRLMKKYRQAHDDLMTFFRENDLIPKKKNDE